MCLSSRWVGGWAGRVAGWEQQQGARLVRGCAAAETFRGCPPQPHLLPLLLLLPALCPLPLSSPAALLHRPPPPQVGDGVFEVLSTSGDTHLGGDDFDKRIVDWLAEDFQKAEGLDLRKDRQALQRLTEAAEKAKIELSGTPQTSISLPFITATADGPKHIDTTITRNKFEQLCSDLLERCRIPVEQALKVCGWALGGRWVGGGWVLAGESALGGRDSGVCVAGGRLLVGTG